MRRPSSTIRGLAIAVTLDLLLVGPALAAQSYGGWQDSNWNGIDGYIRQSGTVHLNSGLHLDWITLCQHDSCSQWTQVGTYQGYLTGHSNPDQVHVFYENVNVCGTYSNDDLGPPPTPNYAYYLSYDGNGQTGFYCPTHHTGYIIQYRMGSIGSNPIFNGDLSTSDGLVLAKTEDQGALLGTDYYGCQGVELCSNGSYGLHLYTSSTGIWSGWTGGSVPSNGNPPYLHTFNNYWSFKTCPSLC